MFVLLVVFLSTVVLHSVAAGGVYCAQTARARAAAMGLDYPGVHGAPDLFEPAHHGMHPSSTALRPHPDDTDEPDVAHYRQSQPAVSSFDGEMHEQADPRDPESAAFLLSRGTYSPLQTEHTTDQLLSFPRGQPVSNPKSNFEEVKHAAPLTRVEASGQSDPVNLDREGRNEPLSFVYNEHDLAVDESVPNRRGMSLSGLPMPLSGGHGAYRGVPRLTGYGLRREVPLLGSTRFTNKGHVSSLTSPHPVAVRVETIRFPGRFAQSIRRRLNAQQFVPGNPGLGRQN